MINKTPEKILIFKEMRIRKDTVILAMCLFIFCLGFSIRIQAPPADAQEIVTVQSEGASLIHKKDVDAARQEASQLAILKALLSQLHALAILNSEEIQLITQKLKERPTRFYREFQIQSEKIYQSQMRVVITIEIIPAAIIELLLENQFTEQIKFKPRVMIAVAGRYKDQPVSDLLVPGLIKEKFVAAGFQVIEPQFDLKSGDFSHPQDIQAAAELGKAARCDIIVTGNVNGDIIEVARLGKYKTCHLELALQAVHSETGQVLASYNEPKSQVFGKTVAPNFGLSAVGTGRQIRLQSIRKMLGMAYPRVRGKSTPVN